MDDDNPYASPQSEPSKPVVPPRTGIWRDRGQLVVGRDARLPGICPITNQPADVRWPAKLRVLSPVRLAWALVLCPPAALLLYAVYFLEGTRLVIPLRQEVLAQRRSQRRVSLALLGLGSGLLIAGLVNFGAGPAAMGWVLILGAAWYDALNTRLLSVDRLTRDHSWIDGACEEYCKRFEEWPG